MEKKKKGVSWVMDFEILCTILPHLFLVSGGAGNPWSPLACSCIPPTSASAITWPAPRLCLCLFFSTYEDSSHVDWWIGPP